MRYFYIVDTLQQVRDNQHLFRDWEAVGTVEPDVAGDRHGVSEVLVAVNHTDHGGMDAWEALPFVHPLPDPLDTTEVDDTHMEKLKRFHGYEQDKNTGKWTKQIPDNPAKGIKGSTDVLSVKPHTRQMLNDHVSKMFPSFRFRIFH